MRLDELEAGLRDLAGAQPAVPDRRRQVIRRVRNRRRATVVAGAVALSVLAVVGVTIWSRSTSSTSERLVAGPDTTAPAPSTPSTNPGPIGDLTCDGAERLVELMPAPGGRSTPQDEIAAFLIDSTVPGLPTQGWIEAPEGSGSIPAGPEHRLFTHAASGGGIDASLELIHLDGGWRVDKVVVCES